MEISNPNYFQWRVDQIKKERKEKENRGEVIIPQ